MRFDYSNHTYRKLTAAIRKKAQKHNIPCAICHYKIDYTIPTNHPMAFTADHVKSAANGGKILGEIRPSHRSCNSRRGNGKTPLKHHRAPKTSQEW